MISPNLRFNIRRQDLGLFKQAEGFSADWYKDSGGVDTIGYGHTGSLPEFIKLPLTEESAESLLIYDLKKYETAIIHHVKFCLTQNQFISLVSLCYNIGIAAFCNSTLLKKLNNNDVYGAANEFLRWNKDNGVILKGLMNRREREKELFLFDMPNSGII